MKYETLKAAVCEANRTIRRAGLVVCTWGNVSGADRDLGVMAIKPSGVEYDRLTPADIVVVDLESGRLLEGQLRPSSDTPTHLQLYRHFAGLRGIVHTHSPEATGWAQAGRQIPCLGTTHADQFHGPVPVTRPLTEAEVRQGYEHNTGAVIVEHYRAHGLDPLHLPAVLVAQHGPFTWGPTVALAVENAIVLEAVAGSARQTLALNPAAPPIPSFLLDKHFLRKHGPGAYYGQDE